MKKIIIFSIVFIGLFMIFGFAQAKTMNMTIPLGTEQKIISSFSPINNFLQQIKRAFLSPILAYDDQYKNIGISCDKVADGSDRERIKYFEFITNEQVCVAKFAKDPSFTLVCNQDACILQEPVNTYVCNPVKWKIIDATVVTTSMDDLGMGCSENHFDDYDQCMMAIVLIKSMSNSSEVASSTDFIQCAEDWSNANSIGITQPAGFINMDDLPSGAGYVWLHIQAGGGSVIGDEVYWEGEVQARGQRPSLDSFTLTAKPQGQTTNSTITTSQTMTVCKGENLNIAWSSSDSNNNILYAGATNEHKGGETLTVGQNGSINRTAYITTNFIFTVKGYAGEDREQTFRSDDLYITVVDCVAPNLSVNLTAYPSSGTAPLYDVDLDADVSGTATGNIIYQFDCTNNGTWEHTSAATTTDPYSIDNLCDYTTDSTYTAKVQVTRGGYTATDTTSVTVSSAPVCSISVSVSPPGSGTTSVDISSYPCNDGAISQATAVPGSGYTFLGWDTNGGGIDYTNSPLDIGHFQSWNIVAYFAASNNSPNIPTLIAPPHNTWINYNPTFQATATDPDNDKIKAYFNILGYGDGWGSLVNSGQTSSWGPLNVGTCFQNWWRAKAQDEGGLESSYSGYWLAKVDKDAPISGISYAAESEQLTFPVTLTESDTCSGIVDPDPMAPPPVGDVEVRSKLASSPAWSVYQDYSTTINNFTYTGKDKYQYQFRYRVKDLAGNWSAFAEGGVILVDINDKPTATNLSYTASDVCNKPVPFYTFNWTYSDPDKDKQSRYILQIDNNSDFSSPQVNMDITGLSDPSPSIDSQSIIVATQPSLNQLGFNTTYYWRVRVYDEHSLPSNWTNGIPFSLTTPVHHYPSCDFTWIPNYPNTGEAVSFTDTSRCWDENPVNGSDCSIIKGDTYLWTITSGDPSTSVLENPSTSFSSIGKYDVILRVTDSDGYTCSITKSVRVNYPLPKWKEILPW